MTYKAKIWMNGTKNLETPSTTIFSKLPRMKLTLVDRFWVGSKSPRFPPSRSQRSPLKCRSHGNPPAQRSRYSACAFPDRIVLHIEVRYASARELKPLGNLADRFLHRQASPKREPKPFR